MFVIFSSLVIQHQSSTNKQEMIVWRASKIKSSTMTFGILNLPRWNFHISIKRTVFSWMNANCRLARWSDHSKSSEFKCPWSQCLWTSWCYYAPESGRTKRPWWFVRFFHGHRFTRTSSEEKGKNLTAQETSRWIRKAYGKRNNWRSFDATAP